MSHPIFSQGFKTEGTRLLDANNEVFIIRGVNNPNIWYNCRGYRSLKHIARHRVNCVRIVWQTDGRTRKLEKIIQRCIELEMIPMVELHDYTGDTLSDNLMHMVEYYTRNDVKTVLQKYEKYLLLNIANEWGNHEMTNEYWKDSYAQAIDSLRKAGYKYTIVIDAPGWGQKFDPILKYGQELIDYDPQKNLLFSIHMYGSWNDSTQIESELQKAYDLNLPVIVGEFGYNFDNGNNNLGCKVNHKVILKTCEKLGYGYLAWSWAGNNKINRWLDMSDNWRKLNRWGREIVENENGIQDTARKASVFTQ